MDVARTSASAWPYSNDPLLNRLRRTLRVRVTVRLRVTLSVRVGAMGSGRAQGGLILQDIPG